MSPKKQVLGDHLLKCKPGKGSEIENKDLASGFSG